MLSLLSKFIGICYNLRSYFLITLTWFNGFDAVLKADASSKQYDEQNGENKYMGICNDTQAISRSWSEGAPLFAIFVVLVVLWVAAFIWKAGFFKYGIDQLGFHVRWINARKEVWYKRFPAAIILYLVCAFIYCLAAFVGENPESSVLFVVMMVLQVSIACFDVYSPLQETVKYNEEVLQTRLKGYNFAVTDSGKIVEVFQDALMSAQIGDYTHVKALTGKDMEEIQILLNNFQSRQWQEEAIFPNVCCGSSNTEEMEPDLENGKVDEIPEDPSCAFFTCSIVLATIFNLRSYVLIVVAWYTGLDSIILQTIGFQVDLDGCDDPDRTAEDGPCTPHLNTCYSDDQLKAGWNDVGFPWFFPFFAMVGAWIALFLYTSGAFKYRVNQLGFHVKWINGRKKYTYKLCVYAIIGFMLIAWISILNKQEEAGQTITLIVFTILVAMIDLYTPLEEIMEFKEDALDTLIKGGYWLSFTDSSKIVETFQDSFMSANKNDYSHMIRLTGLSIGEIDALMGKIGSIPHEASNYSCFSTSKAIEAKAVSPFSVKPAEASGPQVEMADKVGSPSRMSPSWTISDVEKA